MYSASESCMGSDYFQLEPGENVTLDCLMPNGVIIQLTVNKKTSLKDIKQRLWDEARKRPLASVLSPPDSYVFVCVNECAEQEELDDETRHVCDVRPFRSVLKVKWKDIKDRSSEQVLDTRISHFIGKGVHELNAINDDELQEFRKKMKKKCLDLAADREAMTAELLPQLLICPPDICDDDLDEACLEKLREYDPGGTKLLFAVSMWPEQNANLRFLVNSDATADDLIQQVLLKRRDFDKSLSTRSDSYMLKICGREEYLMHPEGQGIPLHQFQYIRSKITKGEIPQLRLVEKPPHPKRRKRPSLLPPRPMVRPPPAGRREVCMWEVHQNYNLTVVSLHNVNVEDRSIVRLQFGLYHGNETLCDIVKTSDAEVQHHEVNFNEKLVFGITVFDLPRMAKLSAILLLVRDGKSGAGSTAGSSSVALAKGKSKKQRVEGTVTLACMTFMALDYKGVLIRGEKPFYMWNAENVRVDEYTLSPTGAPPARPNAAIAATMVKLRLADYGIDPAFSITYPPMDRILECAAQERPQAASQSQSGENNYAALLYRDPLQAFCEQEKETVWLAREDIRYERPECLPKLLSCLRWNSHADVSQMYALLQIWPKLGVDVALELLDFVYPDKCVREFAVNCLKERMSDSELSRYLLQLVQALKFEPYVESDLVSFLLERALSNRKIGHVFFWLLRAEMHRLSVSTRFGVILEAYFYGASDHMNHLRKQLEALKKMHSLTVWLQSYKNKREQGIGDMRSVLKEQGYTSVLSEIVSPHDPAVRLGQLRYDECKYMDSKMKPLWLVWSNADPTGSDIYLIFKNGDDLRQDMLTLQMIAIMDAIWLSEGLDLRMTPYGCLSTGRHVGLIEVVRDAETIANIQKKYTSVSLQSPFKQESLFSWLKEQNPTPEGLKKAVEEFTLSCAGYCVVTYVLGIGDRHSDNIMLKKNGQLFHIDFGHFLGNFKTKFGVKRERVPFVLTNDFVYIINGGRPTSGGKELFKRFKDMCEQAFRLLRQRGNLIIALFMMMVSTGIPELQSVDDIKYLQDTLALSMTEDQALKHFREKFKEALKNSWKTSMNWAVHNAARENN